MARSFGEAFKRVERFDPVTNQVVPTERIVGQNGGRRIEITAMDGTNIFEPMNPDKARLENGRTHGSPLD